MASNGVVEEEVVIGQIVDEDPVGRVNGDDGHVGIVRADVDLGDFVGERHVAFVAPGGAERQEEDQEERKKGDRRCFHINIM